MPELGELPKSRLEAITDGIFAVSMTLLVLDLRLPAKLVDGHAFRDQVLAQIPAFDGYVISFTVLCIFWLAHVRLLRRLERIDSTFTTINLAFLLFTTFVPLLTAFAGRNPGHYTPAVLYGANLIAIIGCEMLMWRYALPRLADASVTDHASTWRIVRGRFVAATAVVGFGLVLAVLEIRLGFNSGFASYTYLLLIVVGIIHPTIGRRLRRGKATRVVGYHE